MDITPDIPHGFNIINSYSDEGFKISEKDYVGSLIVSANHVKEISLSAQDINQKGNIISLLDHLDEIEVLLVGTGKHHQRLQQAIRQEIKHKFANISVDEMTSSAVCRTYNILALEDRKVVAILTFDNERS